MHPRSSGDRVAPSPPTAPSASARPPGRANPIVRPLAVPLRTGRHRNKPIADVRCSSTTTSAWSDLGLRRRPFRHGPSIDPPTEPLRHPPAHGSSRSLASRSIPKWLDRRFITPRRANPIALGPIPTVCARASRNHRSVRDRRHPNRSSPQLGSSTPGPVCPGPRSCSPSNPSSTLTALR